VGDGDCDDTDPDINPGAEDVPYDGVDSDCDGWSDYDADRDGHDSAEHGGDDCDDTNAAINPSAIDAPYDGLDADCAGDSDYDADGDGYDSGWHGGDDCNDASADYHPGAYERPNDGEDQDCDGEDRIFDGVVLDEGSTVTYEIVVPLAGSGQLDVTVLLDTTCSMGSSINNLDFNDLFDAIADVDADVAVAYATFDDYNYSSYGYTYDKPFTLQHQLTDDVDALSEAHDGVSLHNGGDGPESAVEALYQAVVGEGYDQDCDESYDSSDDVLPFLSSPSDIFEGSSDSAGDADTALGVEGGVGNRSGATRLVLYITDNYLRDPDGLVSTADGSPGGCPLDAGSTDLEALAADGGLYFYGFATASTPVTGMNTLADMTGSLIDLDGDGTEDRLVSTLSSTSDLGTTLGEAVAQVAPFIASPAFIDQMWLVASLDYYELIVDISPDPAEDIDGSVTDSVTFTLTLEGKIPASGLPEELTLELDLYIDGEYQRTIEVMVEVPPA